MYSRGIIDSTVILSIGFGARWSWTHPSPGSRWGVHPGLAARLSARLLKEFGSPDEIFRAPLPPVLLYVRGDSQALNIPSISIVGTRQKGCMNY